MKKILKYITAAITGLILILALYIMIFGAIARKNNELLSIFGYSYSYVPTPSMKGDKEDSFDANTIVITKKVKYESIELDDVIVFQSGDILVIHRVIEVHPDGSFTTKGDNNPAADPGKVTESNYQGKLVKHYKFFNVGENLSSYQFTILSFLIILLIIYVIYQIFRLMIDIYKNRLNKIKENQTKEE